MTYLTLGQYDFTTGPDQTGLNTGNLTSTFDTSVLKAAQSELYRMVLGVSTIPSQTPQIVQSTNGRAASLTTLDLTFPSNTTAGNLIVVAVETWANTDSPEVTGITLGGSADNFAVVTGAEGTGYIWADPSNAGGSAALVITCGSGSGTDPNIIGYAWEVSGIKTGNTVAAVTDVSASSSNCPGSSPLTTTGNPTAAANDILFALASSIDSSGNSISWNNALTAAGQLGPYPVSSGKLASNGGYTFISSSGTPASATAYDSGSSISIFSQSIAAFLAGAPAAPSSLPFTVKVDSRTWDVQQTTAGVGYTYDLHQPLIIKQGQQLSVLWTDLPSSTYSAYSQDFTVTAWFRYDPLITGNQL